MIHRGFVITATLELEIKYHYFFNLQSFQSQVDSRRLQLKRSVGIERLEDF